MKPGSTTVVPEAVPKKKSPKMLTNGQLSDLFRRLDTDGNGELDIEEFLKIIVKLKLDASDNFVARLVVILILLFD